MQQTVKRLARSGVLPPRPIFMPLFFAVAAKVGGLTPQQFFTNPTKIANGLRQLQGPLQCDVLCCYADQTLIAEAVGARIGWEAGLPQVIAPPDEIAPDEIESRGRVPIMLEVLRRLRAVLRERVALAVALPGLLTTAEYISAPVVAPDGPEPSDYLALAGGATLQAARLACEAGADLVLLIENELPGTEDAAHSQWSAQIETLCKVARFYEALPVVMESPFTELRSPVMRKQGVESLGAMPCLTTEALRGLAEMNALPDSPYGLALPAAPGEFRQLMNANCALVTTAGDLPHEMDPKDLRATVAHFRQAI